MDNQTVNPQATSGSNPMSEPQSMNNHPTAESTDTQQLTGQVGEITAQNVQVTQGSVGSIKAETATVTLKQGGIGAVLAQNASVEVSEGGIGAVLGREVSVRNSNISIVIAGKVGGDARIMFDLRAGLITGIAIGLVLSAFKMLMKHRR